MPNRVQAGQRLKIPAATFNTFVDAAAKSPTLQAPPPKRLRSSREGGSHGDGAAIVKVPIAAYVEKLYDEGDFGSLGIGT